MSETLAQPTRTATTDDDLAQAHHPIFRDAPDTAAFKKLRKRLLQNVRQAVEDFGMVPPEARTHPVRWLVCLSGGKDSYALLAMLLELKWQGLLPIDLVACNLDQGQPGFPKDVLPTFLDSVGVPYRIETKDTYSIVTEKVPETQTYCALCSRLRRGILYRIAREEGCEAIVLGHHRDDALETFMMNLFHGGRLASMPPKLVNDDGDLFVMRPLLLCAEDDIQDFSDAMNFPIIPCNLCGSQDGLQRDAMKKMMDEWEKTHPGRRQVMFRALMHARPSHLADPKLFDFAALERLMRTD